MIIQNEYCNGKSCDVVKGLDLGMGAVTFFCTEIWDILAYNKANFAGATVLWII